MRSVGYVYRRLDENAAFNVEPNLILATELAETDVLRSVISLPGEAAVNISAGNNCHINTYGRIRGNVAAGIYYPEGTGRPTTGPRNQRRVRGTPRLAASPTYEDSYEDVFGLTFADLSSMADQVVTSEENFPSPVQDNSLTVADLSSITFDFDMPLTGSGIVIIRGNTVISPGSNSLFTGLLYVEGNLTVRAPCEIQGSVVCTGNMTVQGASDYAIIRYDGDALATLMNALGNYRQANSLFLPRRTR